MRKPKRIRKPDSLCAAEWLACTAAAVFGIFVLFTFWQEPLRELHTASCPACISCSPETSMEVLHGN